MNGWAGRDATVSFQDEKPTGQTIGAKQGKRPMRERDTGPDETRGTCRKIDRLDEFVGAYGAVFCDVWGVVHNGVAKHPAAETALSAYRKQGGKVVLLTNSPRPNSGVRAQLDALGFDREAYDEIVTSGDATRALIARSEGPFHHIGPERDLDLFADLDIRLTGADEARAVIVTGLFDDTVESPDDYRDTLRAIRERGLTMICANPDIVVHRGDDLIYCAGALAREYAAIGGHVDLAGKPHRPIYELAAESLGENVGPILAIGDGMMTDIKGAGAFGIDALFVTEGIHGEEIGMADPTPARVGELLAANGVSARAFIPTLR